MIIDGRKIAQEILDNLKPQVENLKNRGVIPTMAVVLLGDNENSIAYIRQKELKANEVGAQVLVSKFDLSADRATIEKLVKQLNQDSKIHGVILQRPAPHHIQVDELEELINPVKEIDGFGSKTMYPVPVAEAVYRMITSVLSDDKLRASKVAVLGKGETAGKPIIEYLTHKQIYVDVIDSKTPNRQDILKNADVVVSAVGKQNALNAREIKKGSIVIGVGLSTNDEGKLRGDFNDEEIGQVAKAYSPTPGGVGPVNVAILMENLVKAASALDTI